MASAARQGRGGPILGRSIALADGAGGSEAKFFIFARAQSAVFTDPGDDCPRREYVSESAPPAPVPEIRPITIRVGGIAGSSIRHWPDAEWAEIPPDERPAGAIRLGFGFVLIPPEPFARPGRGGLGPADYQG